MKNQKYSVLFIIAGIVFVSIACNLISGVSDKLDETKGTAISAVTDVQEGQTLAETAKAFVTDIGNSEIAATAIAMATDVKDSGYLETAQSYVTSEAPNALKTAQAFATEQGPSLFQTSQAYITQISENSGEAPSDIPIVTAEKTMYYASVELVSYFTSQDFESVLSFYKSEMPNNGWTKVDQGWVENPNSAVLYYEKSGRSASITLSVNPVDNQTIVMITIKP